MKSTRKLATLPAAESSNNGNEYGTDTDRQDGWSDVEYEIKQEDVYPPGRYQ
jgi:hypothetical protein